MSNRLNQGATTNVATLDPVEQATDPSTTSLGGVARDRFSPDSQQNKFNDLAPSFIKNYDVKEVIGQMMHLQQQVGKLPDQIFADKQKFCAVNCVPNSGDLALDFAEAQRRFAKIMTSLEKTYYRSRTTPSQIAERIDRRSAHIGSLQDERDAERESGELSGERMRQTEERLEIAQQKLFKLNQALAKFGTAMALNPVAGTEQMRLMQTLISSGHLDISLLAQSFGEHSTVAHGLDGASNIQGNTSATETEHTRSSHSANVIARGIFHQYRSLLNTLEGPEREQALQATTAKVKAWAADPEWGDAMRQEIHLARRRIEQGRKQMGENARLAFEEFERAIA